MGMTVIVIDTVDSDDDGFVADPNKPIKLCEYPLERGVMVTTNDYTSLEEGEFLNDIIINFYLTYLYHNILNVEDRENVYVFSSQFFQRIWANFGFSSRQASRLGGFRELIVTWLQKA